MLNFIQKHLNENCRYLSKEEIYRMNQFDNGPINNVLTGLNKHCYGIWLEDKSEDNYILSYINNRSELSGLACRLKISNLKRNELTFGFSKVVNDEYPKDTELIDVFNTFQYNTITMLEKLNRFTFGNEMAGKNATQIVKNIVGIDFVPILNKIEAFKEIFSTQLESEKNYEGNKVYLMFNPRNNYTKIGRSINPRTREKTLQAEDPDNVIIAMWNAPKSAEKELHDTYREKRVRGEWFKLGVSDLLEIKERMK